MPLTIHSNPCVAPPWLQPLMGQVQGAGGKLVRLVEASPKW